MELEKENERLRLALIAIKKLLAPKQGRKLKKEIHKIVNEALYPQTLKQ